MKVEIIHNDLMIDGFIQIDRAKLRFELFDGAMSEIVTRWNVSRGDAVGVLLYDTVCRTVLLVRQFRYPVYTVEPENAWLWEIVAGSVDPGSTPLQTAIKEVAEEAGYEVDEHDLQYICNYFVSPGGSSQRMYLYAVDLANRPKNLQGGGVRYEAEDIQVIELSYEQAYVGLAEGKIRDGKSIMALTWLRGS